jgi:hypothetical protein
MNYNIALNVTDPIPIFFLLLLVCITVWLVLSFNALGKRRNQNKKALTYVLAAIQCDNPECDWVSLVPTDDVILWHNRQCPKCHNCIIITDEDLKKHREDIKNKNFKKITLDLSKIFK